MIPATTNLSYCALNTHIEISTSNADVSSCVFIGDDGSQIARIEPRGSDVYALVASTRMSGASGVTISVPEDTHKGFARIKYQQCHTVGIELEAEGVEVAKKFIVAAYNRGYANIVKHKKYLVAGFYPTKTTCIRPDIVCKVWI